MEKVIFRGNEILVSNKIIQNEDKKPGYHYYGIRQDVNGEPDTIEECVIMNRWGTVACTYDLFEETHDIDNSYIENDRFIALSYEEKKLFSKVK